MKTFNFIFCLLFFIVAIPFVYPAEDDSCGHYDRNAFLIGNVYKVYLQTDRDFLKKRYYKKYGDKQEKLAKSDLTRRFASIILDDRYGKDVSLKIVMTTVKENKSIVLENLAETIRRGFNHPKDEKFMDNNFILHENARNSVKNIDLLQADINRYAKMVEYTLFNKKQQGDEYIITLSPGKSRLAFKQAGAQKAFKVEEFNSSDLLRKIMGTYLDKDRCTLEGMPEGLLRIPVGEIESIME